jgi:hypothetical protein
MSEKSNLSNGVSSFDDTSTGSLVEFFNRNVSTYPTDVGSPKFDLIPVAKQKDIMVNVARMHARQEYDRIMELVSVLQRQAEQIKKRLDITDLVHAAKYQFQLYHGQVYWLAYDHKEKCSVLKNLGPNDWTTGVPDHIEYITRVKWLGDYTFIEVDAEGNLV